MAQYIHGLSGHPIYNKWIAIKDRCLNKNSKYYDYYGGRGITVCKEWHKDFLVFYGWAISNGWENGLYIDRIDNDKGYYPNNCRFVTSLLNTLNQRLLRSDNISKYRGVGWHKHSKQWRSRIRVNGKRINLGYFESPRLAAIRYDAEACLLNDGRPMNFIEGSIKEFAELVKNRAMM